MKVRPLAFLLLSSVNPLLAVSVTDRVNRLEDQVSKLERLVIQLNKQPHHERHSPSQNSNPNGSYFVRSGDSLWTIAQNLNISLSSLQQANPGINPRRLGVGKRLSVPGRSSMSSTTSSNTMTHSESGTYQVKRGDILGRIAENHNIRLHQLMSANPGLDPRRLKVGAVLNIPTQPKQSSTTPTLQRTERASTPAPAARVSSAPQGVETRQNPYLSRTEAPNSNNQNDRKAKTLEPRLVPVSRNSRLSEIAVLHRTTVAQINQLNDVELSPEQMIRSGSQLYVPGR